MGMPLPNIAEDTTALIHTEFLHVRKDLGPISAMPSTNPIASMLSKHGQNAPYPCINGGQYLSEGSGNGRSNIAKHLCCIFSNTG
jgi:hypothetical protein